MNKKNILFLSYDGLTDPLGQSQILPYLVKLTEKEYRFTIISCEKKERFKANKDKINAICTKYQINWQPLKYNHKIPFVSQIFNVYSVFRKAKQQHRIKQFDLIHARSYVVAIAALALKQQLGIKFLFDTRGFWHEERLGHFRQHFLLKYIFNFFSNKEKQFFAQADGIITLNVTAKKEIIERNEYKVKKSPIAVIPCCADYDIFKPATTGEKVEIRQQLGVPFDAKVISYVGSVSDKLYMLDEMLDFFKVFLEHYPNAYFVIITLDKSEFIKDKAHIRQIPIDKIVIKPANRTEVAHYLKASDFAISFILPLHEKRGCSPTKIGEYLAMNLPVITNDGVGDVSEIIKNTEGGAIVTEFSASHYKAVVQKLENVNSHDSREKSKQYYDLNKGVESYALMYQKILQA